MRDSSSIQCNLIIKSNLIIYEYFLFICETAIESVSPNHFDDVRCLLFPHWYNKYKNKKVFLLRPDWEISRSKNMRYFDKTRILTTFIYALFVDIIFAVYDIDVFNFVFLETFRVMCVFCRSFCRKCFEIVIRYWLNALVTWNWLRTHINLNMRVYRTEEQKQSDEQSEKRSTE